MIRMIMDGKTFTFGLPSFAREESLVSSVKYHKKAKTKKHLRVWLPDRDIWIDPITVSLIEHKPIEHDEIRRAKVKKVKKEGGVHDCQNCEFVGFCPLPQAAEQRAKRDADASPPAKGSLQEWLQSEAAERLSRRAYFVLEGGVFDPIGVN